MTAATYRPLAEALYSSQLFACVLLLAFITGCGSDLDLVPVDGKVTYKGKPLEYGSVMIQPAGNGPLARGTIESDGTFVLGTKTQSDGVRPGRCRVRVTAFDAQRDGAARDGDREPILGQSAIPEKYQSFGTSGIEFEVKHGMQLPVMIELE